MKKVLLLISGLSLIILIGFYFYSTTPAQPKSKSLWELVPPDAVMVFENNQPASAQKTNEALIAHIRSLVEQDSVLMNARGLKEMIISLHITGRDDFGLIYYHQDSSVLQNKFIQPAPSAKPKYRLFEGYTMKEITTRQHGTFTYTMVDDHLVISRESVLIEDVIRAARAEEGRGFTKLNSELFQLLPTDSGPGNLYVNLGMLTRFLELFAPKEISSEFLKDLGKSMMTDVKIENQTLSMNGFALDSVAHHASSLSLFNDQHPVPAEIQKIVSNRSLFFVHYGIADYDSWMKRRLEYMASNNPSLHIAQQKLEDKFKLPDFYHGLGNEVGICRVEDAGQTRDILAVEIKSSSLGKINTLLSSDLKPIENYANYRINKVTTPALVYSLLWPLTGNKNLDYYCTYEKFLLFAENIDVLKKFISDIEEDNTWGKSSEWNAFLSSTAAESNISLVFNGSMLAPWLLHEVSPKWNATLNQHQLQRIRKGSLQFTHLDHNYYFNGVLQFDVQKKETTNTSSGSIVSQLGFSSPVAHMSLVKNHANGAAELFIQTKDHAVALISSDFKVLFKVMLNEDIKGKVHQIDYYKNRKLQYLFLAGQTLHLIDRMGKYVEGFPLRIKALADVAFLSVADYDNTRNYRFLTADGKGNIYMMDKEGKLLTGWNPRSIGVQLFNAPRPVRALGKDFIVAVDVRGSVYAFNRKGESGKNFPVKLELIPSGDWFFEKLNATEEGAITTISKDGIKTQVNLNGKVITRENYVRSSADSKFALVPSVSASDYVISRADKGKIAVLSATGKVLFENDNPGSDEVSWQYFDLGSGRKLFCFRDLQQDFTYAFDEHGQSVFGRPLETTLTPFIVQKRKEGVQVFTAYKNQVRKFSH